MAIILLLCSVTIQFVVCGVKPVLSTSRVGTFCKRNNPDQNTFTNSTDEYV